MHESQFEKEVRLILDLYHIPYKQNCFEQNREMDFLLDNKVNIEVDGPFHDSRKHKIKDGFRDRYLKSFGYEVYRIKLYVPEKKHAQIRNENNKQKFIKFLRVKGLIKEDKVC